MAATAHNKAALERRMKKLLGEASKSGLFNPKAKLDTSQVIDLRSRLAKLMIPTSKKSGTPIGMHKYYKSNR